MSRNAASFKRGNARYKPQPRVLVLCEDLKSSKVYLEEASIHFRSYAVVEFAHCGRTDPMGIVEAAIKRQHDFELVYCVIDRDTHQNFDSALTLAGQVSKVKVVVSYPCFEFWLLLHFCYSRAPYSSVGSSSAADRVTQDLRKNDGMESYAKGKINGLFQRLLPRLPQAKSNAIRTLVDANNDGELNPSTSMHLMICALEDLANLKPA